MGKDLDDLLKSLPPEKRQSFESARDGLKDAKLESKQPDSMRPADTPNANAVQRQPQTEPKGFLHDNKSMPDAYDQKSNAPHQQREIDKMLTERRASEALNAGKDLQQNNVSHQKEQDLER
jgi:hypothetical protein